MYNINRFNMKQAMIDKLQAFFPAYPVEKAWVFGSYARGEETAQSENLWGLNFTL